MSERAPIETRHAAAEAERLGGSPPLCARLSAERWRHSLAVAETAHGLATALGWSAADRERAVRAGLLHDAAKELAAADVAALARAWDASRQGAEPGRRSLEGGDAATADAVRTFRPLLHAPAGAQLAKTQFGISDPDVLRAIAAHPTAAADMPPAGQLLFVADYLEPTRAHLSHEDRALLAGGLAGRLRLPELFCSVLRRKLGWILERGLPLHPDSVSAWNVHCAGRD